MFKRADRLPIFVRGQGGRDQIHMFQFQLFSDFFSHT
jgi:hypothetical protein